MQFKYTILYVDDVPSTVYFYERAFGLTHGFVHDSGEYAELSTGQTKLAFSSTSLMKQLGKNPSSANSRAPTFEIAFETSDVQSALKKAVEAGATLVQEARKEPWGQTTSYVADPNGYLIEVCTPVDMQG